MKKFNELMPNDNIYYVIADSMNVQERRVLSINEKSIKVNRPIQLTSGEEVDRVDNYIIKGKSKYNTYYLFSDAEAAERYVKSQSYKEIQRLIKEAKRSLKRVLDFRKENYEILNHKNLNSEISILEYVIKRQ